MTSTLRVRSRTLRPLMGLLLLATAGSARDLAVVEDYTGDVYLLGSDAAGFHRQRLDLNPVLDLEVGGGFVKASDGVGIYLFGMTAKGIVSRRIDWDLGGHVGELKLGDRIAVATGSRDSMIYVLTDDGIHRQFAPHPLNRIEVTANLAFLETNQVIHLFGVGRRKILRMTLPSRNYQSVRAARNQLHIDWGQAHYLYSVGDEGIFGIRIDRHGQQPDAVHLGGEVRSFVPDPQVTE